MDLMTQEELLEILVRLDWNLRHLANVARRNYSRMRKMASGRELIDSELAIWLRQLDAARENQERFREIAHQPPPSPPLLPR
jgi:hypothetical protein